MARVYLDIYDSMGDLKWGILFLLLGTVLFVTLKLTGNLGGFTNPDTIDN